MRGRGPLLVATVLVLVWHGAWAARMPAPWDWDPSYYLGVARHLAEGDGAVTDAVWSLAWLPPALVHPADLHWMPLASRWLVPFLWLPLDDWRAAQLATVLLAAGWAGLGWWWSGRLLGEEAPASPVLRGLAALFAGLGGGYAGYLSIPDSMGVYGLVGGLAFVAAARGDGRLGAAACVLAALTRSDGFLLAPVVALGFAGRWRWIVAASGPAATALWGLRGVLVAGEGAARLKARAMQALDPTDWLRPEGPAPPGVGERLAWFAEHFEAILRTWLVVPLLLGGPLALLGAWAWRRARPAGGQGRGLGLVALYFLGMPPVLYLLAPAVSFEGSAFRSLSATWPALGAGLVVGLSRLTARYPRPFLPVVAVGLMSAVAAAGVTAKGRFPTPLPDCEALDAAGVPPGAPIFSYDPIGTATRCGHPGIVLGRTLDAAAFAELAERYGLAWGLTAPDGYESWTVEEAEFSFPGWERRGGRVVGREGSQF